MKWGIRRAQYKQARNTRLRDKALKYDKKSAKLSIKSEKAHAEKDLGGYKRKITKAAKYDKKAAAIKKKAAHESDGLRKSYINKRAEKYKYKAAKARITGNRISKSVGYGDKAMKYSVKSDKMAMKAARARKKIANNKAYIELMKRRISKLTPEDRKGDYAFVDQYLADTRIEDGMAWFESMFM